MSSGEFQPLPGMADIGPPEIERWASIELKARNIFSLYGCEEIRTPILERTDLFCRTLGDDTDVVRKEMYSFDDRGGRSLALRPEGTAGVMRYVASKGADANDARFFYIGPMFRAERPQAGRRRQFHQIGAELIGPPSPAADAEAIALHAHLLNGWGLERCRIRIGTRGWPEDQAAARDALRQRLAPHRDALCEDCQRRIDANVLRALDCKNAVCRDVLSALPPLTDFMSDTARAYLDEVIRLLDALDLPFERSPNLVRGLDYYLHTIWEITHPALGAQDALAGGGRYRLHFGERVVEGVGFAIGIERALIALEQEKPDTRNERRPLVWLVSHGEAARDENLRLMQTLRRHRIPTRMCLDGRSVKAQFRAADRGGASRVVIRGDAELQKGVFMLKDLETGAQEEVDMPELVRRLSALRLRSAD
jgi:histidyl-tRNA synthetase